MPNGPLIVQSDKTLLLEVDHPSAEEARRAIAPFAELERAPEHIHTYRVTPLGLWNARAAGHDAEQVVNALITHSRYAVPHALLVDIAETMDRYGRLTLEKDEEHGLVLRTTDRPVLEEVLRHKRITPLLGVRIDPDRVAVHARVRRHLPEPVPALLLGPLLLARQRGGVPRPPEGCCVGLRQIHRLGGESGAYVEILLDISVSFTAWAVNLTHSVHSAGE